MQPEVSHSMVSHSHFNCPQWAHRVTSVPSGGTVLTQGH